MSSASAGLSLAFAWSAAELSIPELATLLHGCVPTYAWDTGDDEPWSPPPGLGVRTARRLLPPPQPAAFSG